MSHRMGNIERRIEALETALGAQNDPRMAGWIEVAAREFDQRIAAINAVACARLKGAELPRE